MDKITIIITGIFVFCIILIYILTIIIKNKKKKEILFNVDRLTTEKNLIISSSLITEIPLPLPGFKVVTGETETL